MNIQALMKQAQQMQTKMKEAQEAMQKQEFQGSSGGGMVKVTTTGTGNAKKIEIDESLLKAEEKEILEDLIIAAFNDAKKKAEEGSEALMKEATGGINLPAGFGF